MKVADDLRGKFKDRMDAYTWQYENLWSKTTHRMLIGLSPNTSISIPPGLPESFEVIAEEAEQIRDASNKGTYDLDLSGFLGDESVYLRFDDAFPQDGWGSAVHEVVVKADGEMIAQFIPGTPEEEPFLFDRQDSQVSAGDGGHRFADNGRYFVYRFTPPEGTRELTASVVMWNQYKVSAGNVDPPSSEQKEPYGYLRDYAVANKAMVFWLEVNDPQQRALFERILSEVEPGTPYLGWFSNDVAGEFSLRGSNVELWGLRAGRRLVQQSDRFFRHQSPTGQSESSPGAQAGEQNLRHLYVQRGRQLPVQPAQDAESVGRSGPRRGADQLDFEPAAV